MHHNRFFLYIFCFSFRAADRKTCRRVSEKKLHLLSRQRGCRRQRSDSKNSLLSPSAPANLMPQRQGFDSGGGAAAVVQSAERDLNGDEHQTNFQPPAESRDRCSDSGTHESTESRHTDKVFRPSDLNSFPGRAQTLTARQQPWQRTTILFSRYCSCFRSSSPELESTRSSLAGSTSNGRQKPG